MLPTRIVDGQELYECSEELADLRVHVCPAVKKIYAFPASAMKLALERTSRNERKAKQSGVNGPTAIGVPIPIEELAACCAPKGPNAFQEIKVPTSMWERAGFDKCADDLSAKARCAEHVVREALQFGLLCLPVKRIQQAVARSDQLDGIDLIATTQVTIQVKCDWNGGRGFGNDMRITGTGNLYIQTAERNPRGLH